MHARTYTYTHTHTHTDSLHTLYKEVNGFSCFQAILEGEPTWLLTWAQQELLPRPSATDHSSLVASSIPLPDWDQWPVTRIQCCLQLPDWVISGLFLQRAPSGLLPDLEFRSPSCHWCSQVRTRSPVLSLGFPWVACSPAPPSQENTLGYTENLVSWSWLLLSCDVTLSLMSLGFHCSSNISYWCSITKKITTWKINRVNREKSRRIDSFF